MQQRVYPLLTIILSVFIIIVIAPRAAADVLVKHGAVIYQLDKDGTTKYNKPAYISDGNRIVQLDTDGTRVLNKPSYRIQDGDVISLDIDGSPIMIPKGSKGVRPASSK